MLDVAVTCRLGAFALDATFSGASTGVTALFGRSGSGKSSVVNAIAGLTRPVAGHVRVGETVFFDSDKRIDLPVEQRRVGYVFQDARLFPHMRVRDNLLYGFRRAPSGERKIALDPVVALLGIAHLLARRPHHLSGGERQRVAIGRALLAQPRILLLDEPLASLDADRKAEILPYVERLRDELKIPIVYVSHAVEEVVRLADRMVVMDHGRVAAAGSVVDIMARLDLHPLTGRYEAGAVLETRIASHDDAFALTILSFAGRSLAVPRIAAEVGARLRVRVRARDVSIARERPTSISIQNIIDARVEEIRADGGPYAEVKLAVGGSHLIARVTRKAVEQLGLASGMAVYALIKTIAIDRHSAGLPRAEATNIHARAASGDSRSSWPRPQ